MTLNLDVLRLTAEAREEDGRARLEGPNPVVAGAYGTWRLVYTVGAHGVSTGGRIRVDTDSDSDWGWPQLEDPAAPEYMTVAAPDGAEVALRLMEHFSLMLVVTGRSLQQGEEIAVTYGDRSGGGPGSRAQTFAEARRYFWVDVDRKGSGEFVPVPNPPVLTVIGGHAARFVLVAPSDAVQGQPFRVVIKAEDEWGNPAMAYRGRVRLDAPGLTVPMPEVAFAEADGGVQAVTGFVAPAAGVYYITARDTREEISGRSNPVVTRAEAPVHRLCWGDPHGGQLVDPRKIGEFLRYARDISAIDFVGFQRNDFAMTSEAYAVQQRWEREFYVPGRFVPLPGFEWSGDLEYGGHHNVYFRRFDQPIRRSSHRGVRDTSDQHTDLPHVRDLYEAYRHSDVVITPHVGGVHADLTHHEPTLEPAVEVTSTHGTFEWFLRETLERRYKLGFVGGSDCYTGRPGDDRPGHQFRRYAKAGLTAVYTRDLTLEGVLEAMRARRCYATTGVRIVAVIEADGHEMGSEYTTPTPPEIRVSVYGAAPLERVEVYRGLDLIYTHELRLRPSGNRVRVLWSGASRKSSYSGIIWDGSVRVTGGRIDGVDRVRFDSPRSRVWRDVPERVRWHSWTCGYPSGVVLTVEGAKPILELIVSSTVIAGARFGGHGESPPLRMAFAPVDRVRLEAALADLRSGPRVIELGILGRRLTLGLAPEPGPERAEFSFRDGSAAPGINPYWVKVVQADMEMAWTSPVFVDYAPDVPGPLARSRPC